MNPEPLVTSEQLFYVLIAMGVGALVIFVAWLICHEIMHWWRKR
jgi:hypothetical protein